MNDYKYTVLCVDDEPNILRTLKRMLRKEGYRILTAGSGREGLEVLRETEVHLIITDQRMPEMSGTEFLARVKKDYPDMVRMVLTGYTEVDAITESINKGHIYKFILKPWNDQNLKLEIRQGLEHYALAHANKKLQEKIIHQNEELKRINENLELLVKERTLDLEIQNKALELSHAVLEDLPLPVVGISSDLTIVLINKQAESLTIGNSPIVVGRNISDFFAMDIQKQIMNVLNEGEYKKVDGYKCPSTSYDLAFIPLSGRFRGRGIIMTMRPA